MAKIEVMIKNLDSVSFYLTVSGPHLQHLGLGIWGAKVWPVSLESVLSKHSILSSICLSSFSLIFFLATIACWGSGHGFL